MTAPELYVVVCRDLHTAIGAFESRRAAVEMARTLTESGPCHFFPVVLETFAEGEEAKHAEARQVGQYL